MKKVFYNIETGEVCESLRSVVRSAWLDWKFYHINPFSWRWVALVK